MITRSVILWVFCAPTAIGLMTILLLVWSLRGGRSDDHPHCRRCGFDLVGTPLDGRCPECGTDLTKRRRAIRRGGRAVSWARLAVSLVIIGATTWWAWPRATSFAATVDWIMYQPAWWLERSIDSADVPKSERALAELVRRLESGDLRASRVDRITRQALHRLTTTGPPLWSASWGDFVEAAIVRRELDDTEIKTFIMQGYAVSPTLFQPDPMWSSMMLTTISPIKAGARGKIQVFAHLVSAVYEGREVPFTRLDSNARLPLDDPDPMLNLWLPWTIGPSRSTMEATFEIRIVDPVTRDVLASIPVTVDITIAGSERHADEIAFVRDSTIEPAMADAIQVANVSIDDAGTVRAKVQIHEPPMDVAMAVIGYIDHAVVPLGDFVARAGSTHDLFFDGAFLPPRGNVESMTLLIRPSPYAASSSGVSLREMWAQDLVFEDVIVLPHQTVEATRLPGE